MIWGIDGVHADKWTPSSQGILVYNEATSNDMSKLSGGICISIILEILLYLCMSKCCVTYLLTIFDEKFSLHFSYSEYVIYQHV